MKNSVPPTYERRGKVREQVASGAARQMCVRCNHVVPETVFYGGDMLCPDHALDTIEEAGLTLNQAMGCEHV